MGGFSSAVLLEVSAKGGENNGYISSLCDLRPLCLLSLLFHSQSKASLWSPLPPPKSKRTRRLQGRQGGGHLPGGPSKFSRPP